MAQIIITIPDAQLNRVIGDICTNFNYTDNGGGLTQAQFAKKKLIDFIMKTCKNVESAGASKTAQADIDTNITLS